MIARFTAAMFTDRSEPKICAIAVSAAIGALRCGGTP
jgi:hypothetical protein